MTSFEETYRYFTDPNIIPVSLECNYKAHIAGEELGTMSRIMSHAHSFEVTHLAAYLLERTNNKPRPIRLPFPVCFIEGVFTLRNVTFHGVLVYEVWRLARPDISGDGVVQLALGAGGKIYAENPSDNPDAPKESIVMFNAVSRFKNDQGVTVWQEIKSDLLGAFDHTPRHHVQYRSDINTVSEPFEDEVRFARRLIMNWHDFVNEPRVRVIHVKRTEKGMDKRQARTGVRPPASLNRIVLTGELKDYVEQVRRGAKFHLNVRFWVRGHWRVLHNKERYGDNVDKRIWIPPYLKGEGPMRWKEYELKWNEDPEATSDHHAREKTHTLNEQPT